MVKSQIVKSQPMKDSLSSTSSDDGYGNNCDLSGIITDETPQHKRVFRPMTTVDQP